MFCERCGAFNKDAAKFCVKCGSQMPKNFEQPVYTPTQPVYENVKVEEIKTVEIINEADEKKEGDVAGLVLGIISTCLGAFSLFAFQYALLLALPGFICACIGENTGKKPYALTKVGRGLCTAGLVIGTVALNVAIAWYLAGGNNISVF